MSERFLLGDRKRINEENIKIFFESGFQKNIRPNLEFSAMRGEPSAVMLNVVAYNPIQHLRPLQGWKRFLNEFEMTGFVKTRN